MTMPFTSQLPEAHLAGRHVFLRADLNVPLVDTSIADDFRLRALEPTLKLLIEKKACIILVTHLDRPHGIDEQFSTRHLLPWFEKRGYKIRWVSTIEEAQEQRSSLSPGEILLLENLRFHKEEQEPTQEFAQQLRTLADYYVNDAFGLLHRDDCSISMLPELFSTDNKTIGLLIEQEIKHLYALRHPERPFILILGGGKVKDKLPFLEQFIDNVDTLIILPALCFTFLKALGIPVGRSLVDDSLLDLARRIIKKAERLGVKIILPQDYLISYDDMNGPLATVETIPNNGIGLAVGERSLESYQAALSSARTIFLNGAMGLMERPETVVPLEHLLKMISQSEALSVVGGGDSVAVVDRSGLAADISFCSTGGGAALYYLIHGNFPALKYIDSSS